LSALRKKISLNVPAICAGETERGIYQTRFRAQENFPKINGHPNLRMPVVNFLSDEQWIFGFDRLGIFFDFRFVRNIHQ
jgi:hypothetical protein